MSVRYPTIDESATTFKERIIERLAEIEHKQWAHITDSHLKHIAGIMLAADSDDYGRIEEAAIEKHVQWRSLIQTDYSNLSESDKELDREWARKALWIVIEEMNIFYKDLVVVFYHQLYREIQQDIIKKRDMNGPNNGGTTVED